MSPWFSSDTKSVQVKALKGYPFFSTTRGHLRLLAFSTLSTIYVNFRLTNDIPTEQGTKTAEKASRTIVRSFDCLTLLLQYSNFALEFSIFPFFFYIIEVSRLPTESIT